MFISGLVMLRRDITTFLSSDHSDLTRSPKLYIKYDDITSIVPSSLGSIKALYK
ncbi:MAG: hypothetical protein ACUVWP_04645 [bacterium]